MRPRLFYGWIIVAVTFVTMGIGVNARTTFSLLFPPILDEFQWDRRIDRLLAFGRGQHFCLGVHLARLEITIMVTEWLKRVPEFRILDEQASRPPSSFQWGWNNLPVEVRAVS